jgi:F-type H+-transporting ATPase subunit a
MQAQEQAAQAAHDAAQAAGGHAAAEGFNAGETIINHVSNSSLEHPLIHLPTIAGIDLSVTKHVFMLWVVAALLLLLMTTAVRRYLQSGRPVPSGFMNALEAVVVFVRDDIVQPNVGRKWVNTWTPLLLTFFFFIFSANAIGLIPIFDVIALVDHYVLHGTDSF